MGLGLHGGGAASVRFLAENGADVTATDLRSYEILKPTIDSLSDLSLRYVLGRHDIEDFTKTDIVVKNPAVRNDSPYLTAALEAGAEIETDISIFLKLNKRPLIAVTGSKGKSTTVSAVSHVLKEIDPHTDLGGNITVSPLTFYNDDKNTSGAPVVLELSSWQLADLTGRGLLKPAAAAVTNIMHDHQDRYHSMDDYAADKAVLFESQAADKPLLLNAASEYTDRFAAAAPSKVFYIHPSAVMSLNGLSDGAWLTADGKGYWLENGDAVQILENDLIIKGSHNRINLLTAAALLYKYGVDAAKIRSSLSTFPGIAHRLEFIKKTGLINWYNDSAATIPEAAAAAVKSFRGRLHLLTGGTDKDLDFTPLAEAVSIASKEGRIGSLSLLSGSGTDKLITELKSRSILFDGPFNSLDEAVGNIQKRAEATGIEEEQTAVLSPGCSSFGMFKNEFDRGSQFRELIRQL